MKSLLPALGLCLSACAGIDVDHYAREEPRLDLPAYFSGPVEAWGIFQKRSGEVARRFHVQITPSWQGDTGTLDERFVYADGEKQTRVWTLRKQPDGSWRGTADDVVGEATGRIAGNALRWEYTLRLPVDGKVYEVQFDDWMWQMDEKTLINRSSMRKFGIELGQVTLFFRKQ